MLALLAAALVAIAVGVPTLAGGEPVAERSAKVKRIARNALTALKTANAALTAAAQALGTANDALTRTERLSFLAPQGTAERQVISVGGLRVFAQCVGSNVLEARVDTTANDSIIHITAQRNATRSTSRTSSSMPATARRWPGDAGDDDNVAGTLVYRNGSTGQVVTISYLLEESYLGQNDCAVLGTVTVV